MILVVLLYHGLQERRGIKHLRVHGKGSKIACCTCIPWPPNILAQHVAIITAKTLRK